MTATFTVSGRLVSGDPYKMDRVIDDKTRQQKVRKDGQPQVEVYVAVAVPKNDPQWPVLKALLDGEARTAWPQYFKGPNGTCTNPTFADKIIDGDGHDKKGVPHANKEGYAGHWVIGLKSGYAICCFEEMGGAWVETKRIKRGDYIQAGGSINTNQSSESPGMYMNLTAVAFTREGDAIASASADPTAMFGAAGGGTGGPLAPVVAAAPPPPPPHTSFMAPPPPPPAGPVMLDAANGVSYAQYVAGGWSHEQLVAAGMVAA